MNEEAKKVMSELLIDAAEGIRTGAGFVMEQIPDVLQQVIVRDRAYLTFCMLLAISSYLLLASFLKQGQKNDWGDISIAKAVITGIFSMIVTMAVIIPDGGPNILCRCFTVWFAPKLYIIEYLADKV